MPVVEIDLDAEALPFIIPVNFGVTKKLQFGRSNLSIGLNGGVDMFAMAGTVTVWGEKETYSYSIMAPGLGASADFEMLLNQDLSFNIGAGYRIGLAPVLATFTYDDEEYDLTDRLDLFQPLADFDTRYGSMNLGGLTVNLGVNYALGELPINLFGFLDPFKKY